MSGVQAESESIRFHSVIPAYDWVQKHPHACDDYDGAPSGFARPSTRSEVAMIRPATVTLVSLVALMVSQLSAAATDTHPNILLVMADDMGYSDIGCYGSEIDTPDLDRLAAKGLKFTQFYNAARCCPTRAALLTGLYPHQAGVGKMVTLAPAKQPSPTQGYLNQECVTLAEVLKTAGYRCYMSGKWHAGEFRPAWPIDRGFDRYYGLISGGMNYFDISKVKRVGLQRVFARNDQRLKPDLEEIYSTDAFASEALTSSYCQLLCSRNLRQRRLWVGSSC